MSANEVSERVARLNTQLRFGRHQAALIEAYKLRTFIQTSSYTSEDNERELERTENVIRQLEKKQASGVQKLVDTLVRTVKRSLNPEDDTAEETLLDLFAEEPGEDFLRDDEQDDEESDSGDGDTKKNEEVPLGDGSHW